MVKLSSIHKSVKIEKFIKKYKDKRIALKEKIKNTKNLKEKMNYVWALHKLPRNSSMVRYRKRCALCGNTRGKVNFKHYQLCRHHVKQYAYNGILLGTIKHGW